MLIDSHVHVGEWRYFNSCGRAYSGFQEIVEILKKKGFSGAVIMPSELKRNRDLLNEVRRHRDGRDPFGCWFFPWVKGDQDLRFLEENLTHIDGLKFHPSLDRWRFSSPGHDPFLRFAERHRLPVLVHCGAWQEIAHYRFVLDAAGGFPGADFILAHQGGTTYELKMGAAAEIRERGLMNVYLDIAGTHEYWLLEHCVDVLGSARFLLGSDFPIRDAAIYPVFLDGTRLREEEKDRIRHKNLLRLVRQR